MWRKAVLAAAVLCIAALAPGQKKTTGAPPANQPPDKVIQILRTPNKAQVNTFVCEALEIKHTNPFNIINFFWAVTSREGGGVYSFANPDYNGGYIIVMCPEYQLQTLRDLARELDRPNQNSAPGSKYIYYRMRHRNVTDPGFLKFSAYYSGTSGILWPDVETNSLLIYDAPAGADGTQESLEKVLDLPLTQVEIGVNIYEVDVNNDGTLGLDFQAWKNGPGQLLLQQAANGQVLHASGIPRTHFHASGGGVFLDYPSAYFDALVQKGKAVSLAHTKITGINRVPAVLTSDEQVIYYQVTNPTPTSRELNGRADFEQVGPYAFKADGKVFPVGGARAPYDNPLFLKGRAPRIGESVNQAIRSVDTGLFLTVVPTVGEQMVNMDLDLRLVTNTGFDGSGNPALNSRQISNSIAVAAGDEIIFGGLVRERKIQSTRKVPLLGSIPVIGYLFGGEFTTSRKTVLVAAVQPRLIVQNDNVTKEDKSTVAKVSGEQVVVLPQSEYCFEQNIPLIH